MGPGGKGGVGARGIQGYKRQGRGARGGYKRQGRGCTRDTKGKGGVHEGYKKKSRTYVTMDKWRGNA